MSVEHATFVIERSYPASPSEVFRAFADPELKRRWFAGTEETHQWDMDFVVGGRETSRGAFEGGPVFMFDAVYRDIVEDERIVYAYDMHSDGKRISVSLATFELHAEGGGTRLVFTEQAAFLDGGDTPATRAGGTESLLDALGEVLAG